MCIVHAADGPVRPIPLPETFFCMDSYAVPILCVSAVNKLCSFRQQVFAAIEVFEGFPFADDVQSLAVHHDLGRARPRVVVGAHREAIGAGGTYGQYIAGRERQLPLLAEKIAGFTDRPDHVVAQHGSPSRGCTGMMSCQAS